MLYLLPSVCPSLASLLVVQVTHHIAMLWCSVAIAHGHGVSGVWFSVASPIVLLDLQSSKKPAWPQWATPHWEPVLQNGEHSSHITPTEPRVSSAAREDWCVPVTVRVAWNCNRSKEGWLHSASQTWGKLEQIQAGFREVTCLLCMYFILPAI